MWIESFLLRLLSSDNWARISSKWDLLDSLPVSRLVCFMQRLTWYLHQFRNPSGLYRRHFYGDFMTARGTKNFSQLCIKNALWCFSPSFTQQVQGSADGSVSAWMYIRETYFYPVRRIRWLRRCYASSVLIAQQSLFEIWIPLVKSTFSPIRVENI